MSRSLTGGRPAREKEINEIRKSTDCTTGKMIFTKLRDKNVALLVPLCGCCVRMPVRLAESTWEKYRMWRKTSMPASWRLRPGNCAFCHYGKQVRHI